MKRPLILCVIALPVLFSFTTESKTIINKPLRAIEMQLDSTKWFLRSIHATDTPIIVTGERAWLILNTAQSKAGGKGSCNSFGGKLQITGDSIDITNIFSTRMYCQDVQHIENAFLKNLGLVNRFEVKDERLLLYKDTKLLLEFSTK